MFQDANEKEILYAMKLGLKIYKKFENNDSAHSIKSALIDQIDRLKGDMDKLTTLKNKKIEIEKDIEYYEKMIG